MGESEDAGEGVREMSSVYMAGRTLSWDGFGFGRALEKKPGLDCF